MTEADIKKKSDWFLYDIGLRHERVKIQKRQKLTETKTFKPVKWFKK